MTIPRVTFFNFLFNGGRGIKANQVDWSVTDSELSTLLSNLGAAGNTAFALTGTPDDSIGVDGDVAVSLVSTTELAGYRKESGAWVQAWTFSGGGQTASQVNQLIDNHEGNDDAHHRLATGGTGIQVDNNQVVALDLNTLSAKGAPIGADKTVVLDSTDEFNPKSALISALPGGGGTPLTTTIPQLVAGTPLEMNPWDPAGDAISGPHGLGRIPDFYETYIEAVIATTTDGYTLGDRIPNVHTPWRITVQSDAVNTWIRPSNSSSRFGIADVPSPHNSDDFTASQWKLVAQPYIVADIPVAGLQGPPGTVSGADQQARDAAQTAQDRADAAFTAAGVAHIAGNAGIAAAGVNAAAIAALDAGGGIFITTAEVVVTAVFPDAEVGAVVLSIRGGALSLYRVISTTASPYLQYVGVTTAGAGDSTIHVTTDVVNIAMEFAGAALGDYIFQIISGTFALYEVISTTGDPYLRKFGETNTGFVASDLNSLLKAWVFSAAANPTAADLGLNIQPWALGGGVDIPYSAIDDILESWAVKDASPPLEIIPNNRLPTARFLAAVDTDDSGKIMKVDSAGVWGLGTDVEGTGGASTVSYVPRWRFVRGETTADPIANAGKVFMGFRYVDTYSLSDNSRTGSHDFGGFAYIYADQRIGYTVSVDEALDMAALFNVGETTQLINLVASLPTIGSAVWGALYGLGDAGVVDDIHYRRNEIQTQVAFSPAQLATGAGQTRRIWGFSSVGSNLSTGFQKGGGLSPEIANEFTEERIVQSDGTVYYQTTLRSSNPLFDSLIGIILQWKSGDEDFNTTDRQITLFRDQTFVSTDTPTQRQYVTDASHHSSNLPVGGFYFLNFHIAGTVMPLVVHASQAFRRVADDEDLAMAQAEVRREIEAVSNDVDDQLGDFKFLEITQASYASLTTKDPNTVYLRTP